jgi:hypothetical protein
VGALSTAYGILRRVMGLKEAEVGICSIRRYYSIPKTLGKERICSTCGICGGKSGTGTGVYPNISVCPNMFPPLHRIYSSITDAI